MLFDGDLLLDMEMTIYEDLMVKCGGFSVTLSGSHFQFRTPFTSVSYINIVLDINTKISIPSISPKSLQKMGLNWYDRKNFPR
jgi:hypothetical protein